MSMSLASTTRSTVGTRCGGSAPDAYRGTDELLRFTLPGLTDSLEHRWGFIARAEYDVGDANERVAWTADSNLDVERPLGLPRFEGAVALHALDRPRWASLTHWGDSNVTGAHALRDLHAALQVNGLRRRLFVPAFEDGGTTTPAPLASVAT